MKTIIIDGKSIEISDESYNAFKKQFIQKPLPLPTNFEELDDIKGHYIDFDSKVLTTLWERSEGRYPEFKYSIFYSEKETKMALALAQLSQLKARYVGDWEPNWTNSLFKYCIMPIYDELKINPLLATKYYLAFPTPELAEKFLKNFALLIKQYYGIK